MIVEIEVLLLPTPDLPDDDPFPRILEVEDFLAGLQDQGNAKASDEKRGGRAGLRLLHHRSRRRHLLTVASRVVTLPGVPAGTFGASATRPRNSVWGDA
ncbi:hypothetical protein [Streptomyces griseorubiginosus]|uniref:hypothetical protein n=1 Tax=Streptomyces griseorubiginosus TaxID=67304 RepID=UPI0033E25B2A